MARRERNVSDRSFLLARTVASYLTGLVMTALLGSLQAYKLLISPLLGSRCRFHPSCSVYAQQSLQRFGPFKGSLLAVARLLRCGPWHGGGVDEVPSRPSESAAIAHRKCANQDTFYSSRR